MPAQIRLSILLLVLACRLPAAFADLPWVLNGDAVWTDTTGTVQLTPPNQDLVNGHEGSCWIPCPIDLSQPFDMVFVLNFGSRWCGGDGMTFCLQRSGDGTAALGTPAVDAVGGGLGYYGIAPSMAVEFDTFHNSGLTWCEPTYDHVAVDEGGLMGYAGPSSTCHGTGSFGAVPALPPPISAFEDNVKDNADHQVEISWDPAGLKLAVSVDGDLRVTYTKDLINGCFGGQPLVYYGFTAAEFGAYNAQSVAQVSGNPVCAGAGTLATLAPTPVNDCGPLPTFTFTPSPTFTPSSSSTPTPYFSPTATPTYTPAMVKSTGLFNPYLYPDPATGPVKVAYFMREAGEVVLKAYQANGFLVMKLSEHRQAAGAYAAKFDVDKFAPGVYFWRLETRFDSGGGEKSGLEKFIVTH